MCVPAVKKIVSRPELTYAWGQHVHLTCKQFINAERVDPIDMLQGTKASSASKYWEETKAFSKHTGNNIDTSAT